MYFIEPVRFISFRQVNYKNKADKDSSLISCVFVHEKTNQTFNGVYRGADSIERLQTYLWKPTTAEFALTVYNDTLRLAVNSIKNV